MPDSDPPCRLLVVDDTEDVRKLVRMMLEGTGVEVVAEAFDGSDGIAKAASCRPDVVVLDVSMPVMDGLTALPDIRRVAPTAWIVVWTASTEDSTEAQALALGADRYIRKAGNDPLAIQRYIIESCEAGPRRGTGSH